MAPQNLSIDPSRPSKDDLNRAAEVLAGGGVLIFPTETVYGVGCSIDAPEAVDRIFAMKGRDRGKPLARYLARPNDIHRCVRNLPPRAARLIGAFWPGPLTLILRDEDGVTTGYRCSSAPVASHLAAMAAAPLVATSANLSAGPDPKAFQDVPRELLDGVDLALDGGACVGGGPSTVVTVEEEGFRVDREGLVSPAAIDYFDYYSVLFVCTGNTCRSPLGEGLLKKRVSDRLALPVEALEDAGIVIRSAGVAAWGAGSAAANGVLAAREKGADLSKHLSRSVEAAELSGADEVFAMARSHLRALANMTEGEGHRVGMLDPSGRDVADPIGGDGDTYRRTARHIDGFLGPVADRIVTWYETRRDRRGAGEENP